MGYAMRAIFTTLASAQDYADACQILVESMRPGYHAAQWDIPLKHYTLDKWAVVIPPEDTATQGEELTDDWFPPPAPL